MHCDNELLTIETSDSSGIFITKDFFPYDCDIEELCYSIREGDNPLHWSDCWRTDLISIINLIEFPHKNISCKRDYISWWLNCRPTFVHESIIPILKQKVESYHSTGEIKNAFINSKYGLEFNEKCLLKWHQLLQIDFDIKLMNLIPKQENDLYDESSAFTIIFDSFHNLPYRSISLKYSKTSNFQQTLDYIYGCIKNEVSAYSYKDKWIIYNSTRDIIFTKESNIDNRTLYEIGIKANDKIICYKI